MSVELKAIASLDGKPFEMEVTKIGNSVDKLGTGQLAGLKSMIAGAFSIGAVVSFGRSVLETMTRIKDLSIQAGISTDEFQGLSYVVRRAGADEQQLAHALSKVDKAQQDALSGNKQMIAAFDALGITQNNLIKMNPAEIFSAMSKSLSDANMTGEPLLATMDIIGMRVAPQLKSAMQDLARNGLQEVIDKSKEAGESFEKDIIQKADRIGDAWEGLVRKIKVGAVEAGSAILDLPKDLAEVYNFIKTFSKKDLKIGTKLLLTPEKFIQRVLQFRQTMETVTGLGTQKYAKMATEGAEIGPRMPGLLTPEQRERKLLADKAAAAAAIVAKDLAQKKENAFTRADEAERNKLDKMYEAEDKLSAEHALKRADIMAGKGIEVPGRARVDLLQAIGGIIGGVAGQGDQAARIAERQAKTQEALEKLMQDSNAKLSEIQTMLDGIRQEIS